MCPNYVRATAEEKFHVKALLFGQSEVVIDKARVTTA
jgi:hypothetical protein